MRLLKREGIIALLELQKCEPYSKLDGTECKHNLWLNNLINLIEQEPVWWRNEGGQMIFEQDNMGKHVDANAGAYEVDELKAEVDFLMEENHSLSSEIEDLYDRANELEDTIRELQEEK